MSVLFGALWPLERINNVLLGIGRVIAIIALAVMVCLILGQVFFRYVLNDAPNWTEEAARFGMLWMTGLMAPSAMRMGGFVALHSPGHTRGASRPAIGVARDMRITWRAALRMSLQMAWLPGAPGTEN